MPGSREIRAGRAYVELSTRANKFNKGLAAAAARLKAWGTAVSLAGLKLAAGAGIILAPLILATKSAIALGSELLEMSQRTGLSVETLSELKFAAEQSGNSIESIEKSVRKMQQQLGKGEQSKAFVETIKSLGLELDALKKLDPEQQFLTLAAAISKVKDPTQRTAAAMAVFGREGAAAMLNLLSEGPAGLEKMRKAARDLGLVMSQEDAVALEAMGDALDILWKSVKQGAVAVGTALLPALEAIIPPLTAIFTKILEWVKQNKTLVTWIFAAAAAALVASVAIVVLGAVLTGLGVILGTLVTVFGVIGTAIGAVGSLLAFFVTPLGAVIALVLAIAGAFLYFSGAAGAAVEFVSGAFGNLVSDALAAFGAIGTALAGGDIALAAKILWLTLRLEWQKGVNFLHGIWARFRDTMLDAWLSLKTEIAGVVIELWREVGNLFLDGSKQAMQAAFDLWDEFLALQEMFGADKSNQRLAISLARGVGGLAFDKEKKKNDADAQGAQEALRAAEEAERKARQRGTAKELEDAAAELAEARKAWEAAVAAGNAVPALEGLGGLKAPQLPDLGAITAAADKSGVSGTFNAAIAGRLASGDVQQQIADNTKKIADNTKNMRNNQPAVV